MSVFLPGILVFGVVVFIHELGHFLMARACGVPVDRFSVGFGPKLFGVTRGRTEYIVAALPLGGYVKMAGDEMPEEGERPDPDTFLGHPWWHRVLIAVAGPGANFFFAIVVSIGMFLSGIHYPDSPNVVGSVADDSAVAALGFEAHDVIVEVDGRETSGGRAVRLALLGGEDAPRLEDPVDVAVVVDRSGSRMPITVPAASLREFHEDLSFHQPPVVGDVINGMPAYVAGVQVGDRITAIDGQPVDEWRDLTALISERADQPMTLTVDREGGVVDLAVTPMAQKESGEEKGRIGIWPETQIFILKYGFGDAIVQGVSETVVRVGLTAAGIYSLFRNPGSIGQSVSGPIAIIEMSGQAAQRGFFFLANFTALISIALMVFNLLPIPVLDGGMVVMSVAEGILRRPVSIRIQAMFQRVGFVLLGSLILFALLNDPLKMIKRKRAISDSRDNTTETSEAPGQAPDGGEN